MFEQRAGDDAVADSSSGVRAAVAADLPSVLALLESASLPTAEVADWLEHFVVAEADGRLVGAAGLEVRAGGALLRSVVVADAYKGRGLGSRLVTEAIRTARRAGMPAVYLLTTTAERWFPRHGFEVTDRGSVPADVRDSIEFRESCPASAAVMVLNTG